MRRSFALLLTFLMLVFSLAACGGGADQPSNGGDGANSTTGGDNGNAATPGQDGLTGGNTGANNGTANGSMSGTGSGTGDTQNGSLASDIKNDMDQAGDNIRSGINDLTGGTPNGINAGGRIGTSFDQMVRNGRVHDKDGNLTDNENAVTPGSDRF